MLINLNTLKILQAIILFLEFLPFVFASPTISTAMKSEKNITITGSGFGTKASAQPLHFDDFSEGTVGHSIGQHSSYWTDPTSTNNKMTYSTDYVRVTGHKSGKAIAKFPDGSTGQIIKNNVGFALTGKIYLNYWLRFDWGSSKGNYWQLKSFAVCNSLGTNGDVTYPSLSLFNFKFDDESKTKDYLANPWNGTGSNVPLDLVDNKKNTTDIFNDIGWYNIIVQADMGTPGKTNGSFSISVSDDSFSRPYGTNSRINTMILGDVNNTKLIDAIKIWLYHAPAPTVAGTATHYIDSIYIDNSWAHVELCDSSTWSMRTHCEIQPATVWNDNKITMNYNPGSFQEKQSVYTYVTDSNGDVNSIGILLQTASTLTIPQNFKSINK